MKKFVAFALLFCILGMGGCRKDTQPVTSTIKTEYSVTIADSYTIVNTLKNSYEVGETVTIQLDTITEHYYVLSVNGKAVEMDHEASDLTYTYFTFTMPDEDVMIQIEDRWVAIPPEPPKPKYKSGILSLTIVETVPSGVAFEYRELNTPYCFYGFDEDDNLYRVLWTDWEGLKEKDRVVVKYEKLEKLTYDEYPDGGWSPQYELTATGVHTANCISGNQLTLPKSGKTWKLSGEHQPFLPYITDELVAVAESKLEAQIAPYGNSSGFYLQVNDDYLCLCQEVIEYIAVEETDSEDVPSGCGIDHKHLFFSERISLIPISTGASEPTQWEYLADRFSAYLDKYNFVPGLYQGDFISQVAQFQYNGVSVIDLNSSLHYDGPHGGGWQLTVEDLFSFHNDFYAIDTSTQYFNRMTTTVPLEGFRLPYGLEFEYTLEEAFQKLGIPTDPLKDFVPDANSDITMTLYEADGVSITYEQWGNIQEPVDFLYPFTLTYTENYEIDQATTVQRTVVLRYADATGCGLGEVELSVTEWNCLE